MTGLTPGTCLGRLVLNDEGSLLGCLVQRFEWHSNRGRRDINVEPMRFSTRGGVPNAPLSELRALARAF
jgi:hypothetical protein